MATYREFCDVHGHRPEAWDYFEEKQGQPYSWCFHKYDDDYDEDKKYQELVAEKNQAVNLIHATEKSLEEFKELASEDEASSIKSIITELQSALSDENLDKINEKSEELAQVSGKFAEKAYKEKAGSEDVQSEQSDVSENSKNEGDVVDADFEEIKDGDAKK